MKAIKVKNQVYELTGERGDFYVAKDNKGKVKMFAKIVREMADWLRENHYEKCL